MENSPCFGFGKKYGAACQFRMDVLKDKNAAWRSALWGPADNLSFEGATREVLISNDGKGWALLDRSGKSFAKPALQVSFDGSMGRNEGQVGTDEIPHDQCGEKNVHNEGCVDSSLIHSPQRTITLADTFTAGRRVRKSIMDWDEPYLLTGNELLEEVCRDPALCKHAARSLYEFCFSSKIFVEGIRTVVNELVHFSMNSSISALVVSKLVVRLNVRLYAFYEGKSFAQYFREGLIGQIRHRAQLASVEERDKLRFLLVLSCDLMRKFAFGSGNAIYFQVVAFQLMRYLLLHKTRENIRIMAIVLAAYGEMMFRRGRREIQEILQYFETAAHMVFPRAMAQEVVNHILDLRCQWGP